MGVDVEIYIRLKDGADIPSNDSYVEGQFTMAGDDDWWSEDFPFVNANLSSMTRYYGVGYERGPWPQISSLLLSLLANPDVEAVYYIGDHSEPHEDDVFTLEALEELNKYYVKNRHEPYRSAFL